jgi:hypothetical protein
MYTIRTGKITEITAEDRKSHETSFDNKIEAVRYMVNTGNTHNLTREDQKLFAKELEDLGVKKGYQLVKEHDSSYTIISNKSLEEIKNNVHERDIFKTLKSLENLNTYERKIAELRHYGKMNQLESFKHTADKELESSYGKIAELSREKEFYSDSKRGNDPERAKHISSELHAKENQFKDLVELSKNYGVKIENTHQELDREIRLREKTNIQEKPGAEKQGKSQAVQQSKTAAPGMKIDLEKTAKQFRSKDTTKQPAQKSKGRER